MRLRDTGILCAALLASAPVSAADSVTSSDATAETAEVLAVDGGHEPADAQAEAVAPLYTTRDHWRDRFEFDYELDISEGVSVSFETRVVDLRRRAFDRKQRVDPLSLIQRENKTGGDAGVNLALFDDRLRIDSLYGWSLFSEAQATAGPFADASGLDISGGFNGDPAHSGDRGYAFAHEIEASLLRSDLLEVSAFSNYRSVDSNFSLASGDRRRGGSAFGDRGKQFEYGGKLQLGPMKATISRKTARKLIDEEDDEFGPAHRTLEAAVTLSLYDFRERSRGLLGSTAAQLIPDAVWASLSDGTVDPVGNSITSDAIQNTSFGMSWSADTWSVGIDYWRSIYDSRQPAAEDADWEGQGLYLSYGYFRTRWGIFATGGLSQYSNRAKSSRSEDLALDTSLTLQLTPEVLPKLNTGVSYGHYATDYVAWSGEAVTRGLSFTASLDFARYLPAAAASRGPVRLELGYRYTATDTRDSFAGSGAAGEHAAILLVQMPL
jgi:hypothetical protein